jgi:hypothetical protein
MAPSASVTRGAPLCLSAARTVYERGRSPSGSRQPRDETRKSVERQVPCWGDTVAFPPLGAAFTRTVTCNGRGSDSWVTGVT